MAQFAILLSSELQDFQLFIHGCPLFGPTLEPLAEFSQALKRLWKLIPVSH
jgi:hypothetical protein